MRVLIFLSLLACSGCSIDKIDPANTAEFRFVARNIYDDLFSPSCDAPSGFSRKALLGSELGAVSNFERQAKGTESGNQLAIARQDVRHKQQTDRGCWNDSDPAFAQHHVEMTKITVRNGLDALRSLSHDLGSEPDSRLTGSGDRSEFRYHARRLVEMARPMCALHAERENDELLTPANGEIDRFERSLADTPYAAHFKIAEADVAYEQSITNVECAERSAQPLDRISADALADVRKQIVAVARSMRE